MDSIVVEKKSKLKQLFCKHKFREFEKPTKNPLGFIPLNGTPTIMVCVKCGKGL